LVETKGVVGVLLTGLTGSDKRFLLLLFATFLASFLLVVFLSFLTIGFDFDLTFSVSLLGLVSLIFLGLKLDDLIHFKIFNLD
jgi:hypothetical protein